jgi:hypothetical protein
MGVDIAECFLVGAIINKSTSSRNDYKRKLKHKERKYSLNLFNANYASKYILRIEIEMILLI